MVTYEEIKSMLFDPDSLDILSEYMQFFKDADNTAEMAEALAKGDFERAQEVSGYTEEEFVERLENISGKTGNVERLEERYDLSALEEEDYEEVAEEIDIDREEYLELLERESMFDSDEEYR